MAETNGIAKDYELVSESIKELFQKYLNENGYTDTEIDIKAGSMRGDNYLGIIAKAEVKGKDKNGENFFESYIIKSAPKSEGLRKFAPINLAYEREIYLYSHVLPAFAKFQEERNIKEPFKSYAQCLRTSQNECDEALIMKDMKQLGFKMQNRLYALDYNHVKLVITQLAKLHAISFALKDQNLDLFNEFAEKMKKNYFTEMDVSLFEGHTEQQCDKAVEVLNPDTDAEAIEKFNKFKATYIDSLIHSMEDPCHPYSVIRHGDCWTNNFLFKYEDKENPKAPTSLCFLDWQLSHVGPPVLDLFYFMYACTDRQVREEHYDDLIKHYHQTLTERTTELGSNIEKLYPFSVLQEQLLKFGRYGMAIGIMLLQFLLSDATEIPDMNTVFDEGDPQTVMEKFTNVKPKNAAIYNVRMRDVILHCAEKNYI